MEPVPLNTFSSLDLITQKSTLTSKYEETNSRWKKNCLKIAHGKFKKRVKYGKCIKSWDKCSKVQRPKKNIYSNIAKEYNNLSISAQILKVPYFEKSGPQQFI